MGQSHILVTCGKGNVASAATILRNGGVLESEEFMAERGEIVQRYWINQPPSADHRFLETCR